jgi:hypothetical protein
MTLLEKQLTEFRDANGVKGKGHAAQSAPDETSE